MHLGADLFLFILFRIHVFSHIHNVLYQFWNFSAIISTYFLPLIPPHLSLLSVIKCMLDLLILFFMSLNLSIILSILMS